MTISSIILSFLQYGNTDSRERYGERVEMTKLFQEDNDVSSTRQWLTYSRK